MLPGFILFQKLASLDASFATKFHIVYATISYIQTSSLMKILFGVGLGNSINSLGIGAHNFFIVYFIETGLFGLILICTFWWILLKRSQYKIGIVLFPFLISGLSFAPIIVPYLYSIAATILVLQSRKLSEPNTSIT